MIAKIFLSTESKIIGLRFLTGPFGFPGFGNGIKFPNESSVGLFPVSAMSLRISAM